MMPSSMPAQITGNLEPKIEEIRLQLLEMLARCKHREKQEEEERKEQEDTKRRLPWFIDEVGLISGSVPVEVTTGGECVRKVVKKRPGSEHSYWYCIRADGTEIPIGPV